MRKQREMTIEWLPEDTLYVNSEYQRSLNRTHINRLVENFNPNLINPIRVFDNNGRREVIDGQHTLEVLRAKGWKAVPALVLNGTTGVEEAADYFVKVNTGRKSLRPLEVFHAALTAKNPQAVAIAEVLAEYGLRVATGVPNGIAAVKKLEMIYKNGGASALRRVLTIITSSWDSDERDRFHGNMFTGLHLFLSRPDAPTNLDRLIGKLRKTSPVAILRKAHVDSTSVGGSMGAGYAVERQIQKAARRRSATAE